MNNNLSAGVSGAQDALLAHWTTMQGMLVEKALREKAQRLVKLFDAVPQLVWTASADGRFIYCNADVRRLLGECQDRAVEDVMLERLVDPEDRQRRLGVWRCALRSGRSYEVEYRIRSSTGGAAHWYLERGERRDNWSAPDRWFVTATRIDEQKRREEELLLLLRRKEQFFAMLLHELRNPLAPIANAIELLAAHAAEPHSVNRARGIIQRQLRQLTALVNDLLDVSRIARGAIALHSEPVDLAEVIDAAVETALPVIEGRRHHLASSVPPAPLVIRADAARLGQVVTNLLINAARYTPPGGEISVMAERAGAEAVVRVKDNGIGISSELLPQIFELFAQVAPASEESTEGMGVGLAVARELVQLHGGSICACSEGLGRGSEFIIRLPLPPSVPDA